VLSAHGAGASYGAPSRRWGFTLAELMIVLVLAGSILGLLAAVTNKLHRDLGYAAARMAGGDQLRHAASMLPLDLRALASAAGDIHAGEARELSLEVDAATASAVVCSAAGDAVVLAPFAAADGEPAGATVGSGDRLWVLVDSDSGESWHGMTAGVVASASSCNALAPVNAPMPPLVSNRAYSVTVGAEHLAHTKVGAPVRITRPLRYEVYRAGDGRWYLGLSTWSAGLSRFATVQPISGPYRSPNDRDVSTHFSYFDSNGTSVPYGVSDTRGITRIEARFVPEVVGRGNGSAKDSLVVVVALRNAR
jgi:hypothetical protein